MLFRKVGHPSVLFTHLPTTRPVTLGWLGFEPNRIERVFSWGVSGLELKARLWLQAYLHSNNLACVLGLGRNGATSNHSAMTSFGWMALKPLWAASSFWAVLLNLKQQHTQSTNLVVGREYHPSIKIYGKNLRVSSRRLKPQGFFFDLVCGARSSRLTKLDLRAGSTLLPGCDFRVISQLTTPSLYDAGFFFPQAKPIVSNPGVTKDLLGGQKPHQHLRSAVDRVWGSKLPQGSLVKLKSNRRFMRKFSLAVRAQPVSVVGGSLKTPLSPTRSNARANPNTGYRLLSAHRVSLLRVFKKATSAATIFRRGVVKTGRGHPVWRVGKRSLLAEPSGARWATQMLFQSYSSLPLNLTANRPGIVRLSRQQGATRATKNPTHTHGQTWCTARDLAKRSAIATKDDIFFKQPIVRYKPGLLRYWRTHRFLFRKVFALGLGTRQKSLTKYVARLSRVSSFSFFKAIELSVLHLALSSKLIPLDQIDRAWLVLSQTLIFINGSRAFNPYTQMYVGDLLYVHTYPGMTRVSADLGWSGVLGLAQRRLHLHTTTWQWRDRGDIPAHVEVDELTSTLVLLIEPSTWSSWNQHLAPQFPHVTFRMYNWKYVV